MDYRDYNDNELIYYIGEGNEDANEIMLKKYEPIIDKMAMQMSCNLENCGIEYLDLKQEGIVGLYNALNSYTEQENTCFYTFALTCIKRRMYSLIGHACKMKNKVLNEGMMCRLDVFEKSIKDRHIMADYTYDPEKVVFDKIQEEKTLNKILNCLSDLEKEILLLKLNGYSYKEIAKKINKNIKNVDNTLCRIKMKVQRCLAN